jgi:hypothetical protein
LLEKEIKQKGHTDDKENGYRNLKKEYERKEKKGANQIVKRKS